MPIVTSIQDTLTPVLTSVQIDERDGKYIVRPVWAMVDRPSVSSYSCGKNKQLASRLAKAFHDGKAYEEPQYKRDVDGNTYVSAFCTIRMRAMNADLTKLGY